MKKKSRFLQTPIEPFVVEAGLTADQVLARMERISFQGRNLATAHRDLAQDAAGRRHDLSRDGRRAVGGRPAAGRRAPDSAPLRRLSRLDRREPLPRSARNARPASLRRIAARRRRRAGGRPHRPRLRHLRERRGVLLERRVDRRLRVHARDAQLHDAGVPLPARRPPLEDHRARGDSDERVPRQRPDFLPGDCRLVDRHGPVAGAAEESRAPATSTSSATSSSRRTWSSAGRGPRRSSSAAARRRTSSTRRACRRSSTATRSADTATRCRS